MILSDGTLREMLPRLIRDPDYELVNPASVDIRVGRELLLETARGHFTKFDLTRYSQSDPLWLWAGDFALVATYEHLLVPNGYAVELKLKSSRAREGWEHSLAFWFDPGWDGIGTMEIRNGTRYTQLPIWCGLKFGQIIVHQLDRPAEKPYSGRYNRAAGAEQSKG